MRRLGSALKRAVTVGAVLALTLGMATPATMSFADDAVGGAPGNRPRWSRIRRRRPSLTRT